MKEGSRALNDFKVGEFFRLGEFECPCCHQVKLVPYLVYLLDKLRKEVNAPVYISSGYRCENYNRKVGGKKHSYHPLGMAAHIFYRKANLFELATLANKVGFSTVIYYPEGGFVHVDIREHGLGLIGASKAEALRRELEV